MDKLQPIIKNRFWILAGLLLPMAMYGFFSANSKLKAATETREDKLKSVLSAIPGGTNDPNEKYSNGLSKINKAYEANVDQSIKGIWKNQQERMTWPPVVNNYVPPKFSDEFNYRGVVAYQEVYERLMRDLQERVEPVMPLEKSTGGVSGFASGGQDMVDVPWKQKVILAASIPQSSFGRMRATSEQVWNAQIDIWLLRLLFDAVARLNEDKDTATEAVLRRIDVLALFGGDGSPVLTGGKSKGGGGESGGLMEGRMAEAMGGDFGGGGYGGGKAEGKKSKNSVSISFNPAQEFGSDKDSSGGSGDSNSEASFGSRKGSSNPPLRYIADTPEKPYLERGFYMSVIIMQDKIPDFLVELASSDWPIRVTRFHVGKNPYFKLESRGGRGGAGGFNSDSYGLGGDDFGGFSTEGAGMDSSKMDMSFGGIGGSGGKNTGIPGVGGLGSNLPEFADAAMQNSNLVQLDLCGVITMYKQPPAIVEALDKGESVTPESAGGTQEPTSSESNPFGSSEVPAESEPEISEPATGETVPADGGTAPAADSPQPEVPAEPKGEAVPDSPGNKPKSVELENL